MSSNIPTRRVTRATSTIPTLNNGKENATARTTRTAVLRAKQLAAADTKPAATTRVTASTAATRAKTVVKPDSAAQGKRKREALGVVSKPGDNRVENRVQNVDAGPGPTAALKGKARVQELKEKFEGKKTVATTTVAHAPGATAAAARQPLRTVSATATTTVAATSAVSEIAISRRTRSSTSASAQAHPRRQPSALHAHLPQLSEEEPEPEVQRRPSRTDDAMLVDPAPAARVVPSPRRFVAARAAAASGLPVPASRQDARRRASAKQRGVREEDDDEYGRAYKKRRTSSDVPDEAEVEEQVGVDEAEADPNGNEWDDLDADDADDPLMVSEYVVDIFQYLKDVEQTTMPNPNYMEIQRDLAWKMRGILTDWLIQVHSRFRLMPETLFLCVNIIDRFLSRRVVSLAKLQLVGITCMFIAAKVEEIVAPSVKNFLHCADSSYTDNEILQAERYVLKSIEWNLSYPNPIHFLRRISKADEYNVTVRTVGKYLMEIQCLEWRLIAAPPSLLAAAAIWLARIVLGYADWTPNLAHYSSYPESSLVPTANLMLNYVLKPIKHQSFYKKYASKKYLKASVFVREWALERWQEGTQVPLVDQLSELKDIIREQRAREEAEAAAAAAAVAEADSGEGLEWEAGEEDENADPAAEAGYRYHHRR